MEIEQVNLKVGGKRNDQNYFSPITRFGHRGDVDSATDSYIASLTTRQRRVELAGFW